MDEFKLKLTHREMMILVISLKVMKSNLQHLADTNTERITISRAHQLMKKLDVLLENSNG